MVLLWALNDARFGGEKPKQGAHFSRESFLCQLRHRQLPASSAPGILLERALFGFETGISTWKPWGAEGSYQTRACGAELLLQPSPHSLSPGLSYGRAGIVPKCQHYGFSPSLLNQSWGTAALGGFRLAGSSGGEGLGIVRAALADQLRQSSLLLLRAPNHRPQSHEGSASPSLPGGDPRRGVGWIKGPWGALAAKG